MERQDPATVLVVDDDDRLVASVRRVLAYEGYRVLTAGNGPEGLQLARDESPDLIILDVMLPGVDGLEFARRLRRRGEPGHDLAFGGRRARQRTMTRGLRGGVYIYIQGLLPNSSGDYRA